MPVVKVEHYDDDDYMVQKVVMDNTPNLDDTTGKVFLKHFEQALTECHRAIENGYRLTDFWSNPDAGVEFILKKKKV